MTDDNRDSRARFLLLSDANYTEWAMQMEAELIEKGLWEQVFVELDVNGKTVQEIESEWVKAVAKRNAKKMGEARARMITRVETSQLVHMREQDPMVIWAKLAVTHQVRGLATRLAKCCKFLTVAKGNEESITSWASRVKGMAFDLEDIGGMVTDEDIMIVLTMGLNKEYDHFVASIDATPTQELTVDYVVTRMLNEETQYADKGSTYANEALVANVVNTKSQTDYNKKYGGRKCWQCDKASHVRSECNVPSDVKCGNCGGKGHTLEACLKPRGAEDKSDTAATAIFAL
jgi:hypothetical protein